MNRYVVRDRPAAIAYQRSASVVSDNILRARAQCFFKLQKLLASSEDIRFVGFLIPIE